jgi:acyl-CoA thioester hydrolase
MFRFPIRVYYEDTDAGGVVYYANYLKFAERARTEWLRSEGVHQAEMLEQDGVAFVVADVRAKYMAPARLDDALVVESRVTKLGRARIAMEQIIRSPSEALVHIDVAIACVDRTFSPTRMPTTIHTLFARQLHPEDSL